MLRVHNVVKRFGGLWAVNTLSFVVEAHQIVGLIGPNGAGKTTLFDLISGFMPPDAGSISFEGKSILNLKPHRLCKLGVARTFQIAKPLENLTVKHNIRIAAYNSTKSVKEAEYEADRVTEFLGMQHKRQVLASSLTIADRKRLEVARALATRPKLILLDEVMAGLRPREIEDFLVLIFSLKDMGITIFMIEHIMKAIMTVSQKVIVINYGEKIAEGPPEFVTKDKKVIKAYLGEENGTPGD